MISSTASCLRCARLTAELRNAATESVAETMRTASMPAVMAGKEIPMTRPTIATTTIISRSVTPRRLLPILPTEDVGIDPFTAGLAVGAKADDFGLIGNVLARE